ncbi:MAG TPA: hypothetical protein VFL60_01350 [Gaiellaceae bacterium]|nr:hypothetical protein [Gaiellaceae bacterium]
MRRDEHDRRDDRGVQGDALRLRERERRRLGPDVRERRPRRQRDRRADDDPARARAPARAEREQDEREAEQRTVPRDRVEAAVVDGETRDEQECRDAFESRDPDGARLSWPRCAS